MGSIVFHESTRSPTQCSSLRVIPLRRLWNGSIGDVLIGTVVTQDDARQKVPQGFVARKPDLLVTPPLNS